MQVNFVAVTSPAYEGAFRLKRLIDEAPHRHKYLTNLRQVLKPLAIPGFYLTFLPPNHLRVAPYGEATARSAAKS